MANGSLRHFSIAALHPGLRDVLIVGVIIAKHEARRVNKKDGSIRWVTSMTIRDSPEDFITLTAWTDESFSRRLDDEFHIGDVIEVGRPRVELKSPGSNEDKYEPVTSSAFRLTFSEETGTLGKHEADPSSSVKYMSFLYITTQPSSQFWTLDEIHQKYVGVQDHPTFVNVLVCVAYVGPIKKFVPKNQECQSGSFNQRETREVTVFDRTHMSTTLKLWDFDWIHLADDWQPKKQILFIADVRVDWDAFRCNVVLTATSKTIITFSPSSEESTRLSAYASQVDVSRFARTEAIINNFDYKTIQRAITVLGFQRLVGWEPGPSGERQLAPDPVTSIVYGYVTRFNIDRPVESLMLRRCNCGTFISKKNSLVGCQNQDCPYRGSGDGRSAQFYNLRIDISDSTGTLMSCKLTHSAAEVLLGPLKEFAKKTEAQRLALKNEFILNPIKVYLLGIPRSSVFVLHLHRISVQELADFSPIPPMF